MAATRIIHALAGTALAAFVAATPALAQGTGTITGHVLDDKAKPVVGAMLTLKSSTDAAAKPVLALTDAQGAFSIDGLAPGSWNLEIAKSNLGYKSKAPLEVKAGAPTDAGDLKLYVMPSKPEPATAAQRGGARGGGKAPPPDAAALREQKRQELQAKFTAADASQQAGNFDDAISQVMAVSADVTSCATCFAKIGDIYSAKSAADKSDADKKTDLATAEKYYKQAIDIDPASPEPYAALASMYNQQGKLDDASRMSAKANELASAAGGTGNADALYNQGVILWNQQKAAEAEAALQKAVAANPKMAEAQYLLGVVLVNENKLPDAKKAFQEYLKLDPKGPHAADAKAMIDAIGGSA